MIRKFSIAISLLVVILSAFKPSWAYDKDVHSTINEKVAKEASQLDLVLKNRIGIPEGVNTLVQKDDETKRIWEWIAYGGEAEDFGKSNIVIEKDLSTRAYNHFHDPLKAWDEAGLDSYMNVFYKGRYWRSPVSSIIWGLYPGMQDFSQNTTGDWSWNKAREYYYNALIGRSKTERDHNFADCFRALGQVMHLLQDASVPLHTRNDVHIFPIFGIGRWTYETYTKENKDHLDYTPDQSGDLPPSDLLSDPNPDPNYNNMIPVSGLFDRNMYNEGSPIPANNAAIGLAEYSNANFFSQDTIWTYQHPSLDDTNYAAIDWLNPTPVNAEDGKNDNRIYIRKTAGETIDHLAAADYWSYEYVGDINMIESPFLLDKTCWEDYAEKLVPRAVGYSAELLDYFFRGELEIEAPDGFVYSITDGSITPHQFVYIRAKVKNVTPDETMQDGQLIAVAKYKRRNDYQPDLSTDPPTESSMEDDFSYSVSDPVAVTGLSSTEPAELFFNFTSAPIPAGITDFYLQVVFKGTLGNETDTAIAIGIKDLNEPQQICLWNATDKFYLDGVLRTGQEIRNNPAFLLRVDFDLDGIVNETDIGEPYIDPYDITTKVAFYPITETPQVYNAAYYPLPPGRYGRIIMLTDMPSFYMLIQRESSEPVDNLESNLLFSGVVNQKDSDGIFQNTQVDTFRGIIQHQWSAYARFYPYVTGISTAPWPGPVDIDPYPATIYP